MSLLEKHILSGFAGSIQSLRDDVLIMGSYALRGLDCAVRGVLERDSELCRAAIDGDSEIDEFEKAVDDAGVKTLVRFSPVAADLREVIAAMKISGNLERVGDQGVTIARRGCRLNGGEELSEIERMQELFGTARELLSESLRCYGQRDVKRARELIGEDQQLDEKCREFDNSLGAFIIRAPEKVHSLLHLVYISRSLERIGDHASNIAENVIFLEEGRDVRHGEVDD